METSTGLCHRARFLGSEESDDVARLVALSEALRSADLLFSVSAFGDSASDEAERRRQEGLAHRHGVWDMTRTRAAVVGRIFDAQPGVEVDGRRVRVGPYLVHLNTGLVTRDGDLVAVDEDRGAAARPLPWLPYDEHLLERVVRTVARLQTA